MEERVAIIEKKRNSEIERALKLEKAVQGLACRPIAEADPERVLKETETVAIRKQT